jgi:hypothetical protein
MYKDVFTSAKFQQDNASDSDTHLYTSMYATVTIVLALATLGGVTQIG